MFIRGLYLFDGLGNFLEPHMTNTVTVPRLNQKYIFLILIINILQMTAWFADTTMFPNYYTICN